VGSVLGWPPLVWAMRVALLVLLAGCSYVYLLLIAPFFRPANIRRMVTADLPRVMRIGAEIAGTRGEVHFVQDRPTLTADMARSSDVAEHVDTGLRAGDDDTHGSGEDQR
jgi:hypothetical protein